MVGCKKCDNQMNIGSSEFRNDYIYFRYQCGCCGNSLLMKFENKWSIEKFSKNSVC